MSDVATEVSQAEVTLAADLGVPVASVEALAAPLVPATTDPAPPVDQPVYRFAVLGSFSTATRSYERGERLTADDVIGVDVSTLLGIEDLFDLSVPEAAA